MTDQGPLNLRPFRRKNAAPDLSKIELTDLPELALLSDADLRTLVPLATLAAVVARSRKVSTEAIGEAALDVPPIQSPIGRLVRALLLVRCIVYRQDDGLSIQEMAGWLRIMVDVTRPSRDLTATLNKMRNGQRALRILAKVRDKRVKATMRYLSEHYAEPIVLKSLAERVGLSSSRLQHLFCAESGRSVAEFVREQRLLAAADSLLRSHERVSQICYSVGFNDLSHFDHVFKERFGCSPRAFRAQARSEPRR